MPRRRRLPFALGIIRSLHGKRREAPSLEIVSQPGEHHVTEEDGVRFHSIDSGRPCPTIAPHPMPCDHEEGGIGNEVVQVTEPTIRAVGRPLVQLRLHTQYLGSASSRSGHRSSVFTGELLPLP